MDLNRIKTPRLLLQLLAPESKYPDYFTAYIQSQAFHASAENYHIELSLVVDIIKTLH